MEITKIEIRPMKSEGNLKAFCSVIFDEVFIVHSIKIIEGREGLFVAMPSRAMANGEFRDIAHPISNDFRLKLEQRVLQQYQQEVQALARPEEDILTEDVTF